MYVQEVLVEMSPGIKALAFIPPSLAFDGTSKIIAGAAAANVCHRGSC
jgi:hypothetical protein